MKVLFIILVLSVGVILVTLGALWWRLHRHMRRSRSHSEALENALAEIQPEHQPMDKT